MQEMERGEFGLWVRKILWRRAWQPASVFLPGESGQRSLAGYSPWGHKESDTTEATRHAQMLTLCESISKAGHTAANQTDKVLTFLELEFCEDRQKIRN